MGRLWEFRKQTQFAPHSDQEQSQAMLGYSELRCV